VRQEFKVSEALEKYGETAKKKKQSSASQPSYPLV